VRGKPVDDKASRRCARARDAALVSDRDEPRAGVARADVGPTRDVALVDGRVTEGVNDATADAHSGSSPAGAGTLLWPSVERLAAPCTLCFYA